MSRLFGGSGKKGRSRRLERLLASFLHRKSSRQLFGLYRSTFRGRGLEFSEHRVYSPGDEVRFIDWKVSARRGELFVKLFVEERQRNVLIAIDLSSSMAYRTGEFSKLERALELALFLSSAASANGDKVGIIGFSDRIDFAFPPAEGGKKLLGALDEMWRRRGEFAKNRRSEVGVLFREVLERASKDTVVFIISDFLYPLDRKVWRRAAARLRLVPIGILDPSEVGRGTGEGGAARPNSKFFLELLGIVFFSSLFFGGLLSAISIPLSVILAPVFFKRQREGSLLFFDLERGERAVALSEKLENRKISEWRDLFAGENINFLELTTEQDPLDQLVQFFAIKSGKRAA